MALSFLDLPVEVMLLVISYIDTVPTLHSLLSTKKVRYQLAGHFKIVLDYPDKQPKMFPFQDVFEVIRVPSLSPTQRASSIFYLVEIDMDEPSFHSNTFYPDGNGVYSKLQSVLPNYAGRNVALCLSVSPSGSSWLESEIEMATLDPVFAKIFTNLKFQAVHVLPSGQPLRSIVFDYKKQITYGEVLSKQVAQLFEKGAENSLTELSVKHPSPAVILHHCMKSLGTIPKIEISSYLADKTNNIPGGILKTVNMIWPLKKMKFERLHQAKIGAISKVENVTIEMAPDAPPPQDFLRALHIEDFEWQFSVTMRSAVAAGGYTLEEVKLVAPFIHSLSSKTLSSLSVETHSQIPNLSNIDLPNLSALSLIYHNRNARGLLSFMTWDTFTTSKIQYLRVNDVNLLKKCFFATNLTRLDGLRLDDNITDHRVFEGLLFRHLQILKVESAHVPSTNAPKLRRLQWICPETTSDVFKLAKVFPRLIELEIHELSFSKEWNTGYGASATFRNLEKFTWVRLPPDPDEDDLRGEEQFTRSSSAEPVWSGMHGNTMWNTKKCSFMNNILHLEDVSLSVARLDSVEHIVLANVKDFSIYSCQNLKMITDTCKEGDMRLLRLGSRLPNVQFVTYKSNSRVHELHRSIKQRVFFKRIDERERQFYYVYEREDFEAEGEDSEDEVWDSEDESPDSLVVEREYTSADRVLTKYGAEVEGLKEWLTEKS